ncbi:hypothetical protein Lal_00018107 [Lupinus albus]|uniref:Putative nepenthesin n=1 Tax=Lupinus albus TaxID=3870 RepID=A0A6A5M7Q7_LUPAL|nr:putative nepenthesin [Lupinus albus]KAF1866722.1 hypothetical protein Lal_00018107 [Lupinus albus]
MKEVVILAITLIQFSILSSAESNGVTIDIIHRDSPLSPYYNSSMTRSDVLINAAFRSISRAKSFKLNPSLNLADETIVIPNYGDYLMQIFVGNPPTKLTAIADTGSDVTWVQCLPCEVCYKQDDPIFDPRNSETHHVIPCDVITCRSLFIHSCGNGGECQYEAQYDSGSFSKGILSTDTISFNSNNGGQMVKYDDTIMGCGYNNVGNFKTMEGGVVGLGGGPLSLASQIGTKIGKKKFSYCLLPYDYSQGNSKMKFGVDTQTQRTIVFTTPLVIKFPSTYYYLSLESVSINGKLVKPFQNVGNIVIDSGTTLTSLKSDLYDQVEAAIIEVTGSEGVVERDQAKPYKLCYRDGTVQNFPLISFYFFDADYGLHFTESNVFGKVGDFYCLLMISTEEHSILGNFQQVSFNIEYDLDQKTVSFAEADCTKE